MRAVVLGDAADVRGLGLVGVGGVRCGDPAEAAAALAEAFRDGDAALLILSPEVARWLGPELAARSAREDGPLWVVLPDGEGAP